MNYVTVINIIFLVIGTLFSIYLFHFVVFAISGLVHKKRYPKVEEKCRYGIIISAKDEENVIGRLINSIRDADYPQDKLDIFVIAHNCKDKTGEIAQSLGAIVIVDNNKEENTLGQAYHYAFKHIENISSYDGFIFFNADNTVSKNYFDKLNDAFVYYDKKDAISTFRSSLNANDGILPAVYGYYFGTSCSLAFSGRNNLNVSGRVTGCGFVVPSYQLINGWNFTSITEDIEYSANTILNGKKIRFCYDATFYDEQPNSVKTMWFQRLRWAKGQHIISKRYFPKLFSALFSRKHKNKLTLFVTMSFHSYLVVATTFITILQIVALLLSPLFNVSLYDAFLFWNANESWFHNMFYSLNTGYLFFYAKTVVLFIVSSYITALFVLISAHEKFKDYRLSKKILGFLFFPLFLALEFPLDIVGLFKKEVKWKKIPHGTSKK